MWLTQEQLPYAHIGSNCSAINYLLEHIVCQLNLLGGVVVVVVVAALYPTHPLRNMVPLSFRIFTPSL